MRNGIFPAISVNKDVTVISNYRPPMWAGESWGNTEGKEYLPSSSHQTAATPFGEPHGSSGCEKHRILAPDSWDAYQRNNFSEPRLLHLPIYRKALNSFTWDVWFSLISNNLLMFRLPVLCCKTSVLPGFSPRLLWAVLLGLLELLSPRLEVLNISTK